MVQAPAKANMGGQTAERQHSSETIRICRVAGRSRELQAVLLLLLISDTIRMVVSAIPSNKHIAALQVVAASPSRRAE